LIVGCASGEGGQEFIRGVAPIDKQAVSSVSAEEFPSATFRASDGTIIPYRLLVPSHLKAGVSYPLVVQFHGSGGIGTDNTAQLDRLARSWAMPDVRERYQAFVLVPQFHTRSANYGPASPEQKAEPSSALDAALELVRDVAARRSIDRTRIYAVGFSMGGSAAWLAPSLDPTLFAAIAPVSGIAPDDALARIYKDLPVFVVHGDSDSENPMTADRRFFQAVRNVGGRKIRFRTYEALGHRLPGDIYPGFWWRDWLFAQRRQ
jgi:predicted peptidase